MAVFGGTHYVRRATTINNISNSDAGTIGCWFKTNTDPADLFVAVNSGGDRIELKLESSTGKILLTLRDSSNTILWDTKTATDYVDDAWHHVAATWDLSAGTGLLYVDALADKDDQTAPTNGNVDYAGATEWVLGAETGGTGNIFTGSLYDFAFWPGVTVDLTDEDSLHLLVANDAATDRLHTTPVGVKPVGYGREGRYLGEPAAVLFSGSFQENRGNGGVFTATGTFDEDDPATATSSPNPFRLFPRWRTPGQRWYLSEQGGEPWPKSHLTVENREGLTSFGKRIALEEVDAPTRRERPGMSFSDIILGIDQDDDNDDFLR